MILKSLVKTAVPGPWWRRLQERRWKARERRQLRREAIHRLHPYLFKADRGSALDYLCEFEHDDLERARRSVLWYGDWDVQTRQVMETMERLQLLRDGLTVVDYGCGVGRITTALLERHRLHVHAVDRSPAMRRHARHYIPARHWDGDSVTLWSDADFFAHADALRGRVDLILFVEVLQHIPEPIAHDVLSGLRPFLTPGGRVFVYGNDVLDVDGQGAIRTRPISRVLAPHFTVERSDVWPLEPQVRHSYLCTAAPASGVTAP